MLFNIIRYAILAVLCLLTVFIIKKKAIKNKRIIILVFILLDFALVSLLYAFPLENLFVNFKSPENVFNYSTVGNIEEILDNDDSCMIIYSKDSNTYSQCIVPKTDKGYKIPSSLNTKKVFKKLNSQGSADVYNLKGTNDYYLFCTVPQNNADVKMYNDLGQEINCNIVELKNTNFVYISFNNYKAGYYITVNNEKVPIS